MLVGSRVFKNELMHLKKEKKIKRPWGRKRHHDQQQQRKRGPTHLRQQRQPEAGGADQDQHLPAAHKHPSARRVLRVTDALPCPQSGGVQGGGGERWRVTLMPEDEARVRERRNAALFTRRETGREGAAAART